MATPQTTTSLDVQALRARFPALARLGPDGRPFVWADAPGGSQAPESVIAASRTGCGRARRTRTAPSP